MKDEDKFKTQNAGATFKMEQPNVFEKQPYAIFVFGAEQKESCEDLLNAFTDEEIRKIFEEDVEHGLPDTINIFQQTLDISSVDDNLFVGANEVLTEAITTFPATESKSEQPKANAAKQEPK